ncbi:MAG: hypothetical protein KatS3mg034_1465 [Vicingaceae bacterium]|nr:MAG: hypothetical protein KatS3mg034_1465 [Vicingaceae bacterium]
MKHEFERVMSYYEWRKQHVNPLLYTYFNSGNLYIIHSRERQLLSLLKKKGYTQTDKLKLLDFGCGTGGEIRRFIQYGFLPENITGVDILQERIDTARKLCPSVQFYCKNILEAEFEENSFDCISQFTVFSSIHPDYHQAIADKLIRLLKPGGCIIWYDFHVAKKSNHLFPIKKQHIRQLFGRHCDIDLKKITLLPPLARKLAPASIDLCHLLEKMKVLNTHYLGIFIKS